MRRKRSKQKRRPLIYVEFIDHASGSSWEKASALTLDRRNETARAVGWLVKENREILQLASWDVPDSNDGGSDVCMRQNIVKGAILKRRRLKV